MKLPTLYKRTSKGAIEQWTIWVEPFAKLSAPHGFAIVTEYGHVDGKLQQAREVVVEGKNLGKKNATTAQEQAESQARSEWETKLTRKGYTEDINKAKAGKNEGAGGIRPMLAHKFTDYGDELEYPSYAQPKLDGIRCIAIVGDDGKVTLWSREQKPFVAVPRIAEAVEALKLPAGTVLDGELYNHALKADFEKIASCIRKHAPASEEEQALIQYHIYDLIHSAGLIDGAHFGDRTMMLGLLLASRGEKLVYVETKLIKNYDELTAYLEKCLARGYEGCMARSLKEYEENKRSHYLLKLKKFDEAEFPIIGAKEGVGKMEGKAVFECRTLSGKEFDCKMEGPLDGLRKYLTNPSLWQNKVLTVKFQGYTNKNKVPRFPVGKAVRDYE